jgi:hypothetical protein
MSQAAQLKPLPPAPRAGGDNWPKGWWRNTGTYSCCGGEGTKKHGHKIRHGEPIYLDGQSGHMFCEKHAPDGSK